MQNSGLQMKKLVLGFIVLAAFIGYAFIGRNSGTKSAVALTNSGSSGTSTSLSPTSGSSSGSGNPSNGSTSGYKDGTFSGSVADAFYGKLQVSVVIRGGKITDVQFLQYPNDNPHTQEVSNNSLPQLKQEAISAQTAKVNVISGATQTSEAFVQSLQAALNQA